MTIWRRNQHAVLRRIPSREYYSDWVFVPSSTLSLLIPWWPDSQAHELEAARLAMQHMANERDSLQVRQEWECGPRFSMDQNGCAHWHGMAVAGLCIR